MKLFPRIIRLCVYVFSVILFNPLFSQNIEEFEIQIPWQEPKTIYYDGNEIKVPTIANQSLDGLIPTFLERKNFKRKKN